MDRTSTPLQRVKQIQQGRQTALAWTTEALESARTIGSRLNAFVTLCSDTALQRASTLDALTPDQRANLPLGGMPVAVKDNICYDGYPTTCGSRMLAAYRPPYTASAVALLENAGAIVIGKTNMDEFGMGSASETSWFGPVENPLVPEHTPGGSSGGSAAAVSAGIVPLALGSDTGGSVRQPAAFCGVCGLKPTYGAVSRYGLTAFCSSTEQISPIAGDLDLLDLAYNLMAVWDPQDSTSAPEAQRSSQADKADKADGARLTVGLPADFFGIDVDRDIQSALQDAASRLESKGHLIKDVSLPNVGGALAAYYLISSSEASANLARFDGMRYGHRPSSEHGDESGYESVIARARGEGFGSEVKRRILLGTYALSAGYYDEWYAKAVAAKSVICHEFEQCFMSCDVLLTPATPTLPFSTGALADDPAAMYSSDVFTVPASLAGIPALVVPWPTPGIGLQLMAAPWHEPTLFRTARLLQEER